METWEDALENHLIALRSHKLDDHGMRSPVIFGITTRTQGNFHEERGVKLVKPNRAAVVTVMDCQWVWMHNGGLKPRLTVVANADLGAVRQTNIDE